MRKRGDYQQMNFYFLCLQNRRGIQQEMLYLDSSRVMLKYLLPLSEVVVDMFDQIKSLSSGYAR